MMGWPLPPFPGEPRRQPPVGTVAMYLGDIADVADSANPAWDPCRSNDPRAAQSATPGTGAAAVTGDAGAVLLEALDWMVCDGRVLNVSECAALYAVLGTRYGNDGPGTFRLPDLRGTFVRGVDAGAGVDPDVGNRRAPDGSGKDPGVGSLQCDALQVHAHTYVEPIAAGTASSGSAVLGTTKTIDTSPPVDARTSTETRPRNVAVYYIIRYR